ncbi:hypothetical protein BST81_24790 [Leptolyngbya sp. 'hensonii']|uniref:PAS domain S-box protein n=1 Tax=Leptolyngbya sp. 'hensonii' TaxID=1922337 RepID=UPI00094F80F8|nr:PAS domain S-box protein [Leptolyngbya sp. 'hensonii']OLP15740.1 hypothetical protein BST81_24790 [Leptolyngbya sp. 'hensonii']
MRICLKPTRLPSENDRLPEACSSMNHPMPENEAARLAVLNQYRILDTEPEPVFDNLARLVAEVCEARIGLLGFQDGQRLWCKASLGTSTLEVPLTSPFWVYTLAQADVVVIPDVLADERFQPHSLSWLDSHLRFYAGVPITVAGHPLGLLCALDQAPHDLQPHQVQTLRNLAHQVALELDLRRQLQDLVTATTAGRQVEEALRKTKDETELRVAERTAELVTVNRRLQLELDERKRVEAALRESQARFAGILEIADDAIISVDRAQCITLFNRGAERIFGFAATEVLGQPLDCLLPPRYVQSHQRHVAEFSHAPHQARRMGERREIFGRRKDGSEFPADASISRLDLGGDQIFTVILRDVTQRKAAEAAMEQLSRQNELLLNSVGEGLCGLDLEGQITFVNPAAAKFLDYEIDELIGRSISILLPTDQTQDAMALEALPIYTSLRAGTRHQATNERFRRQDGSTFSVEYVSTPIRTQDTIVGAVISFKDITERQIVERMKDEFISVVSHELRTPLTSIHGSLGMLASGLLQAQPEISQRLLQIAVDSTDRLVRLINDILDIERMESGKVTLEKQKCDTADLITRAIDTMKPMADKTNITLSVSATSITLWADSDRIIQTLTNLLSNAIKFSPQGSTVWLQVSWSMAQGMDTRGGEPSHVLFTVKDQGRGIPADKLETVFERFQQVDASDSRNQEGTGLGLAICRSIIEQHGGQIWVESTLRQGSTFFFTLPAGEEVTHDGKTHPGCG